MGNWIAQVAVLLAVVAGAVWLAVQLIEVYRMPPPQSDVWIDEDDERRSPSWRRI